VRPAASEEKTMPEPTPSTVAADSRPFVVVSVLVLAVWASALVPRDWFTSDARPFTVTTGSAPDLAATIRSTPRAIVFVDSSTSTYSALGRERFLKDARRLARTRGRLGVRFFVVERQYDPVTVAWLDGLRDERVEPLGRQMPACGGLIWLESGRVVEADAWVGYPGTDPDLEGRTLALWRGR
jgi:hypothetical protein